MQISPRCPGHLFTVTDLFDDGELLRLILLIPITLGNMVPAHWMIYFLIGNVRILLPSVIMKEKRYMSEKCKRNFLFVPMSMRPCA